MRAILSYLFGLLLVVGLLMLMDEVKVRGQAPLPTFTLDQALEMSWKKAKPLAISRGLPDRDNYAHQINLTALGYQFVVVDPRDKRVPEGLSYLAFTGLVISKPR